jgi:cytoskeletal protein CcmA (bactofilin family)
MNETTLNIVAEGTRIEGQIHFENISRVHGTLAGQIQSKEGSTLILSETSVTEGTVSADLLMIEGYVRGDIVAKTKVTISKTGRVVGNIRTPSLLIEFGGYFEGRCEMEKSGVKGSAAASPTSPSSP